MLLTKIHCDGCGRTPNFWEWVRGELTSAGYADWRHPGIVFRELGCPITYDSRARCAQYYWALFGRQMPEEMGLLCPECQAHAEEELPGLVAASGDPMFRTPPPPYR